MRTRAIRRQPPAEGSPWQVDPITDPATDPTDQEDQTDQTDQRGGVPGDGAATLATPGAAAPAGYLTPRVVTTPPGGGTDQGFTWVGAHGGAGITSLARVAGVGLELGQRWPDPRLGWPTAFVIVARSNTAGLDAAARMIQEILSATVPDLTLGALIVVADAPGKPPKTIRTRIHEISGAVPAVLSVPWIPSWREQPYTPHTAVTTLTAQLTAQFTAQLTPSGAPPSEHTHQAAGEDFARTGTEDQR